MSYCVHQNGSVWYRTRIFWTSTTPWTPSFFFLPVFLLIQVDLPCGSLMIVDNKCVPAIWLIGLITSLSVSFFLSPIQMHVVCSSHFSRHQPMSCFHEWLRAHCHVHVFPFDIFNSQGLAFYPATVAGACACLVWHPPRVRPFLSSSLSWLLCLTHSVSWIEAWFAPRKLGNSDLYFVAHGSVVSIVVLPPPDFLFAVRLSGQLLVVLILVLFLGHFIYSSTSPR